MSPTEGFDSVLETIDKIAATIRTDDYIRGQYELGGMKCVPVENMWRANQPSRRLKPHRMVTNKEMNRTGT